MQGISGDSTCQIGIARDLPYEGIERAGDAGWNSAVIVAFSGVPTGVFVRLHVFVIPIAPGCPALVV